MMLSEIVDAVIDAATAPEGAVLAASTSDGPVEIRVESPDWPCLECWMPGSQEGPVFDLTDRPSRPIAETFDSHGLFVHRCGYCDAEVPGPTARAAVLASRSELDAIEDGDEDAIATVEARVDELLADVLSDDAARMTRVRSDIERRLEQIVSGADPAEVDTVDASDPMTVTCDGVEGHLCAHAALPRTGEIIEYP